MDYKNLDGIEGFFDGRSAEERERIKNTLETAFPRPDASAADRPEKQPGNTTAFGKIIDTEDILAAARDCLECVCLAVETLDEPQRGPILRVVDIASRKIDEALALLDEYCGKPASGGA